MNLDFIAYPLGKFLYFIYNTLAFNNYGLAIIIFTAIVRLVLLPLTIKQYKSSTKMQLIQPQLQDIQKKYKYDREKMNQEMMKLYSENNINPAGGCLPLLIQMPIILSLYWVIVQPLKFMLNKTAEQINTLVNIASNAMGGNTLTNIQRELTTLNFFNENREYLSQVTGILDASELIDFNFLGLELGRTATYSPKILFGPEASIYLPLLLLPIIGVITTYFSSKMAMPAPADGKGSTDNNMANSMSKSMLYMGPVITLLFSFQLPAGVILYWITGYVVQIFQQLYINKVLKKQMKEAEQAKKPAQKQEQKKELQEAEPGKTDGSESADAEKAEDASVSDSVENREKSEGAKDGGSKGKEGSAAQKAASAKTSPKKKSQANKKDKYAEKKKGGGKKK
jgi:YidC/Oxa1 family membrane protein insertase